MRFSAWFTGTESIFADHVIRGVPMLSAAACIEMVRAAMALSGDALPLTLKRVIWLRPVRVNASALTVHVCLKRTESRTIAFSIYSESHDGDAADASAHQLHCQGHGQPGTLTPSQRSSLVDQAHTARGESVAAQECYRLFEQLGVQYGLTHRTLRNVVRPRSNGVKMAIGELEQLARTPGCLIDPGTLDGALQATVGVWEGDGASGSPSPRVPFAVDSIDIHADTPVRCTAYILKRPRPDSAEPIFDLDLCGESGSLCVRLRGMIVRPV